MSRSNLPVQFSQKDLERARLKGQVIGWLQGAAIGIGGMLLLKLLGWIPALVGLGVGGFILYKVYRFFSGPSKKG